MRGVVGAAGGNSGCKAFVSQRRPPRRAAVADRSASQALGLSTDITSNPSRWHGGVEHAHHHLGFNAPGYSHADDIGGAARVHGLLSL